MARGGRGNRTIRVPNIKLGDLKCSASYRISQELAASVCVCECIQKFLWLPFDNFIVGSPSLSLSLAASIFLSIVISRQAQCALVTVIDSVFFPMNCAQGRRVMGGGLWPHLVL